MRLGREAGSFGEFEMCSCKRAGASDRDGSCWVQVFLWALFVSAGSVSFSFLLASPGFSLGTDSFSGGLCSRAFSENGTDSFHRGGQVLYFFKAVFRIALEFPPLFWSPLKFYLSSLGDLSSPCQSENTQCREVRYPKNRDSEKTRSCNH